MTEKEGALARKCEHQICGPCSRVTLICRKCHALEIEARLQFCDKRECFGLHRVDEKCSTCAAKPPPPPPPPKKPTETAIDRKAKKLLMFVALHMKCNPVASSPELEESFRFVKEKEEKARLLGKQRTRVFWACVMVMLRVKQTPARLSDRLSYLRAAYQFCRDSSGASYDGKKNRIYPTAASFADDLVSECESGSPVSARIHLREKEAQKVVQLLKQKHRMTVECETMLSRKQMPGFQFFMISVFARDPVEQSV